MSKNSNTFSVVRTYPAGHPRGSWPAEEYAQTLREEGDQTATVTMDLKTDNYKVLSENYQEDTS